MKLIPVLALAALTTIVAAQQISPIPSTQELFEHAKTASVIILAGKGAGRLHSIATGVIISKDGVVVTALHAIKNAAEVQVRLANGEVYDQVDLLGIDERRDVAALKISAGSLQPLVPGDTRTLKQGDPVYAMTNAGGLTWSATEGILSAIRPAEEIPGAGSGFRILQFSAPVAPGSSGGALVDRSGALIGIITSMSNAGAFAIPIESVLNLPDSGRHIILGSGSLLQMPAASATASSPSSESIAHAKPDQIIKEARTINIRSKTAFLTVDTLDRALWRRKDWPTLGLTIVKDPQVADLLVEIDRPLFTYIHTFVIVDKRTSILLGSGKVTAFDGSTASDGLAKEIIKIFSVRLAPASR